MPRRRWIANRLQEKIETGAHKGIDGYFQGLTKLRCNVGGKIRLFEWEKEAVKDIAKGDLKDPNTWRKLKEEGRDAKELFIKYLQDKHLIPETMLLRLADQSTMGSTRRSFLKVNEDIKRYLRDYLDRTYVESGALGLGRTALVGVAQQSEAAVGAGLIIGGGVANVVSAATNTDGQFSNPIDRMGIRFGTTLKRHFKTHRRAMASPFTESDSKLLSYDQVLRSSQRLFSGSRIIMEGKIIKQQVKASLLGVAAMHTVNILTANSLSSFFVRLGEAAVAASGGYTLYRRLQNATAEVEPEEYDKLQNTYLDIFEEENRGLESEEGAKVEMDLDDAEIDALIAELTAKLHNKTLNTRADLVLPPWMMGGSSLLINNFIDSGDASLANPLVTGNVIMSTLSPLVNQFTWDRQKIIREREIKKIEDLIDAIDTSDYRSPSYIELEKIRKELKEQGLPEVNTLEDMERIMSSEPLQIKSIDLNSSTRTMEVQHPFVCEPGKVCVVIAPEGTGKNDFIRTVLLEQGNIAGTEVTKGTDLRLVNAKLIKVSEATQPEGGAIMAEQLTGFIRDPQRNMFKKELLKIKETGDFSVINEYLYNETEGMNGNKTVERILKVLLTDNPQREIFIKAWTQNPSIGCDVGQWNNDEAIAGAILTVASYNYLSKVIGTINSVSRAAAYLARVPSPSDGMSAGESSLWKTRKFLTNPFIVGGLDEASSHVRGEKKKEDIWSQDEESILDSSSAGKVADGIEEFLEDNAGAVLFLIEHHSVLINQLIERGLVDKFITATKDSTESNVVWKARSLDDLYAQL